MQYVFSPEKKFDPSWSDSCVLEEIERENGKVWFVVFGEGDIPAAPLPEPSRSIVEVEAAISAYAAAHPQSITIGHLSGYQDVFLTGDWPETITLNALSGDSTVIIIVNEYGVQTTINADGTTTVSTYSGSGNDNANENQNGSGSGTSTGGSSSGSESGSSQGSGAGGTNTGGDNSGGGSNTGGDDNGGGDNGGGTGFND